MTYSASIQILVSSQSHTITKYSISNEAIEIVATLDFNGKFIDTEEIMDLSHDKIDRILMNDKKNEIIGEMKNILLADQILYLSFVYLFNEYNLIYDLKNEQVVDCGVLLPDINHLFIGGRTPVGQTADELIFALDPSENISRFERLSSMDEYREGTKKYQKLFESINRNIEGNPALLFFKPELRQLSLKQ
jgi:hypothetical protein